MASNVTTPYPTIFAAWVFDQTGGQLASARMFKAWAVAGLVVEAEEGFAPTAKGRATAENHARRAQREAEAKAKGERKKRRLTPKRLQKANKQKKSVRPKQDRQTEE